MGRSRNKRRDSSTRRSLPLNSNRPSFNPRPIQYNPTNQNYGANYNSKTPSNPSNYLPKPYQRPLPPVRPQQPEQRAQTRLNKDSYKSLRNAFKMTVHNVGTLPTTRVLLCASRQIRKEILHAFKKTGKKGQKKPRITQLSKIKCK